MRRATIAGLWLAVLLGANYFLRHTLEASDTRIYSFIDTFYPTVTNQLFGPGSPWWRLLLPIPELGGGWLSTTVILTHAIEMRLSPPVTWYLFNAALMLVSFVTSWSAFRSLAFSFTLVICMGFGTQLYATYAVTGSMGLCLLLIYYEVVLLCAVRVVQNAAPRVMWRTALALGIIVTALAYESWLDFAVFLWLAAAWCAIVAHRFGKREWWPGLLFGAGWLGLVCVVYLYIKIHFGYGQLPGAESDVVFNYPTLAPKIEDVISNVLTQFYLVITNFLPPTFMTSTAFYSLGGDRLVELQNGYHWPYSHLVVMQYLFLWRYYAGAAFVVFLYGLAFTLRRTLEAWSPDAFAASLLLLMTATGGPTHAFVKARPMNSMPLLGYHVLVGVLGVALLLSYFARFAMAQARYRRAGTLVVACLWAMIFWGALVRPGVLSHESAQVGLGEGVYPDPRVILLSMIGLPSAPAAGAAQYRLMKFVLTPAPPPGTPPLAAIPFGMTPEPLPNALSDLKDWKTAPGVTTAPSEHGYRVVGNSSDGGYQLSSPLIPVAKNHRLLVRVRGSMEHGHACLGVMNQSARWLLPPVTDRGELSVDTGDNQAVMFVFINCNRAFGAEGASVFEVESVSYALLMSATPDAAPRP